MDLATLLTDEVVTLRPFRRDDAAPLYEAVCESLAALHPWMEWAHEFYSEATARDYVTLARSRWEEQTLFAFAINRADELVGGCTLSGLNPVNRHCNLGYWVRSSQLGHGYAGRAARLAARFGFNHAGLVRVEIVIAEGNTGSQRVAEKIGAHYDGKLLNRMVVGTSIYDAHMYSLIPSDVGIT
jgi:RimJ/RimL family protein N-acetyltransferase